VARKSALLAEVESLQERKSEVLQAQLTGLTLSTDMISSVMVQLEESQHRGLKKNLFLMTEQLEAQLSVVKGSTLLPAEQANIQFLASDISVCVSTPTASPQHSKIELSLHSSQNNHHLAATIVDEKGQNIDERIEVEARSAQNELVDIPLIRKETGVWLLQPAKSLGVLSISVKIQGQHIQYSPIKFGILWSSRRDNVTCTTNKIVCIKDGGWAMIDTPIQNYIKLKINRVSDDWTEVGLYNSPNQVLAIGAPMKGSILRTNTFLHNQGTQFSTIILDKKDGKVTLSIDGSVVESAQTTELCYFYINIYRPNAEAEILEFY